jgi:hypothetical protein
MRGAIVLGLSTIAACGGLLPFGEDDPPPPPGVALGDAAPDAEGELDGSGTGTTGESDGAVPPKRVFVTRGQFTGDFGGRAQADAICASAAAGANRAGTFIAYLAEEDGGHPALRFPVDQTWVLLDGDATVVFTRSPARQTTPAKSIAFDEHGDRVSLDGGGDKFVWTGVVTPPSYPYEQTCNGWVTAGTAFAGYGDVTSATATWQEQPATASECIQRYRLYCFER